MTTLISPSGERVEVVWIRPFCREHGLDAGNIFKVISGERQHHKGWRSAYPATGFVNKPWGIERYTHPTTREDK